MAGALSLVIVALMEAMLVFQGTPYRPDNNIGVTCGQANHAAAQEDEMTIISAAALLKDTANTAAVSESFKNLGFEVQTISPAILLLMADPVVFERGFGGSVTLDDTGAHYVIDGNPRRELPLNTLPLPLRSQVIEVEFETPPDFGPGNY